MLCDDKRYTIYIFFFNLNSFVQKDLVQATYWHDPLHEETYRKKSTFLSDINNELEADTNSKYADNLNKLEKYVIPHSILKLLKMFYLF